MHTFYKVPDTLTNGAKVLAVKQLIGGHATVVAEKSPDSVHPFVTWAVDENGDAYWGHYFKTYDEALEDWKERL